MTFSSPAISTITCSRNTPPDHTATTLSSTRDNQRDAFTTTAPLSLREMLPHVMNSPSAAATGGGSDEMRPPVFPSDAVAWEIVQRRTNTATPVSSYDWVRELMREVIETCQDDDDNDDFYSDYMAAHSEAKFPQQ